MENHEDQNHTEGRSKSVTLKEYVDVRFELLQRAVDKAEMALGTRLTGMNEFRETLKDQAGQFVTREELTLIMKPILDSMKELCTFKDVHQGKASQTSLLFFATIALISFLFSLLNLFLKIGAK